MRKRRRAPLGSRCGRRQRTGACSPSYADPATADPATSIRSGGVQDVVGSAIGGMNVTTTIEGLERYPINLHYPREPCDNLDLLRATLVPMPNFWIYVDLKGIDVGTYIARAKRAVADAIASEEIEQWKKRGTLATLGDLRAPIYRGAVQRGRPKAMTVADILPGLLPIMWSRGASANVMKRIGSRWRAASRRRS